MTCVGLADELMPKVSLTSIRKTASIVLLFCFRQFSLDQNEQEKAKQKEQGTLTPSRGSSYLKFFTIVQKRGTSGGQKSACHNFPFSLPEQISRPGHHSRKNVTQQKEQKWHKKKTSPFQTVVENKAFITSDFGTFLVFYADCTGYPQSTPNHRYKSVYTCS